MASERQRKANNAATDCNSRRQTAYFCGTASFERHCVCEVTELEMSESSPDAHPHPQTSSANSDISDSLTSCVVKNSCLENLTLSLFSATGIRRTNFGRLVCCIFHLFAYLPSPISSQACAAFPGTLLPPTLTFRPKPENSKKMQVASSASTATVLEGYRLTDMAKLNRKLVSEMEYCLNSP